MVTLAIEGIDLFKIANRSISGWVPGFKAGSVSHTRQPFCSQLEERLMLWLEYNPQVARYARGDIGREFATTYRLPTPSDAPFSIGYAFEGKPHTYLPDIVGTLTSGKLFIAEAGMEDDKRGDRNLARAEAARRLARQVLVDRPGIITEQASSYALSAKGTVENLFRWMTERFEKRLPNSSYGVHDVEAAAQAGEMTLEALERCFYQAIVDDYQQAFNDTRRQRPL